MSFLQPWMLFALPLMALPILIHLINQWRYQTKPWGAMMFLLAANRMNRGFARVRQWLILAMRTAAIAALIFAISRPLASGLWGLNSGGAIDTTIVLMDRSPSMQQMSLGGTSKLETGRRQLASALETLGSTHWIAIDSNRGEPQTFESLEAMMNSSAMQPSSVTTDLPTMMDAALAYLQKNKPGATEIWICSDLRASDWNAESGTWALVREGFNRLPQSVRFHLLAYPDEPTENFAIQVTDVRRDATTVIGNVANDLLVSLRIARAARDPQTANDTSAQPIEIPVQIEIDGRRSEVAVKLQGNETVLRDHRVSLAATQTQGWGRVSIPADTLNEDNEYFFVYDEPAPRRVVVVSEDREATRPLEIASAVAADGTSNASVDVVAPDQLDSLDLEDASLVLWQTNLPDKSTASTVERYIQAGGQVIFFPPTQLISGVGSSTSTSFLGMSWDRWIAADPKVTVTNWRGDQDLLAATNDGAGLPVGQLEFAGYAKLNRLVDLSELATLASGDPLLSRVPTERGGAYFFAASPDPKTSSLADSGVVLFIALQRAIERGVAALGNTSLLTASGSAEGTGNWRQIVGRPGALSTEYTGQAGVYQDGNRLLAVNRSSREDQRDRVTDAQIEGLFADLPLSRVDDSAGSLAGIVREVWRSFLIAMIVALLLEATLCMPRVTRPSVLAAT